MFGTARCQTVGGDTDVELASLMAITNRRSNMAEPQLLMPNITTTIHSRLSTTPVVACQHNQTSTYLNSIQFISIAGSRPMTQTVIQ